MVKQARKLTKRTTIEGVQPHSPDAEIHLLAVMFNSDEGLEKNRQVIQKVLELGIGENDFHSTARWKLYNAIVNLYNRGDPVDMVTVLEELKRTGDLEYVEKHLPGDSGDPFAIYLDEMLDSEPVASPEIAESYARIILEYSKRRFALRELALASQEADDDQTPLEAIADRLETLAAAIRSAEEIRPEAVEPEDRYSFPNINQELPLEYMRVFKGVTEAPESFHFFGFATVAAMVLGRSVYVMYPRKIYPNIFALLVGRPGMERKTTVLGYAGEMAEAIPPIQTLPAIASYEGLLEAMSTAPGGKELIDPARTLVLMDEFKSLLSKARIENLSNLIPQLNTIYDCPDIARLPTKVSPVTVERPFLCILSGIQPGVIEEAFKTGDIHGGFAGRWMYVIDRTDECIPRPPAVDIKAWNGIIKELATVRDHWTKERSTEIKFTEEAARTWDTFYTWWKDQNPEAEMLKALTVRAPDHVLKLAIIFCALDRLDQIHQGHMDDAVRIGSWLMRNAQRLFGEFGESPVARVEKRVLEILSSGPLTRRQVRHRISGKVDSETYNRAVKNLQGSGMIEERQVGRRKELIKIW